MYYKLKNHDILYNDAQLGPYPEQKLKRVDKPTTVFVGEPRRKHQWETSGTRIRENAKNGLYSEAMNDAILNEVFGKKEPMAAAFTNIMRPHLVNLRDNLLPITEEPAPLPDDIRAVTRHIKSFVYFMGADAVGICEVPEYACYLEDAKGQPFENHYKYAIVFLKRKHLQTTLASSGHDRVFDACSHQAYQQLALWSYTLANYLRRLGYDSLPSCNSNYVTVMPAMIIAAGLGEGCRMGFSLNPFFGSNFKSACVLTNMPLLTDKPIDFGLQSYCDRCHICADVCPAHAISTSNEKEEYNGYLKWKIDYEKHSLLGVVDQCTTSCGRCTDMCPWNRPDSLPGDFADWDGSIEWLHAKVDAHADYLRSHNYERDTFHTNQWWFDFMLEDGKLIIPKTAQFEVKPQEETPENIRID